MADFKKILILSTLVSSAAAYRHEKTAADIFEDYFLAVSNDDEYLLKKYQGNVLLKRLKEEKQHIDWFKKQVSENISIKSLDGLNLSSSLLKADSKRFVILLHDHFANKMSMLKYARFYHEQGFNIMLIDQRSSGVSDGDYYTYGLKEQFDLLLWCDYLRNRFKDCQLLIHGIGAGANTALLALDIIDDIKVIAQAPVSDLKDRIMHTISQKGFSLISSSLFSSINRRFRKISGFNITNCHFDLHNEAVIYGEDEEKLLTKISELEKKGLL